MTEYDYSEPLIRDLVKRNHRPIEHREQFHGPVQVRCSVCSTEWPCPALRDLREWEGEALKKQWMRLPEESKVRDCHCPDRCQEHPILPWYPVPWPWRVTWDSFPTYTSTWTWRHR